jgi:hypothetical protein
MPKTELPFAKRQDRKQLLQRRKQSETAPALDGRMPAMLAVFFGSDMGTSQI